jgi:hypothetical protein
MLDKSYRPAERSMIGMKTKHTRGMRNIPTIQGLNKQPVPTARPQAATELARLEHEKARLQRELRMWINNQERTGSRLRLVEERLALVQQVMVPPAADGSTKPVLNGAKGRRVRQSLTEEADSGEGEAQGWQEIPLEY